MGIADTKPEKISIAVISDNTRHFSLEASSFDDLVVKHLIQKYHISRLIIKSAGAAQHFKNYKTMAVLSLYTSEYDLNHVEWNFQVNL